MIDNNGVEPDTFSRGDWATMLRANVEAALGLYRGGKGNILLYIGAPGHDYSWQYEAVRNRITSFLAWHFASS